MHPVWRTWLEIDLQSIANNARLITRHIGFDRKWMAVVKADGYGHGSVPVAKTALENGAFQVAVATIEEALDLREADICQDILVLSYCPTEYVGTAIDENITLTVFDLDTLYRYEDAIEHNKKLKVHLKIDTGMGRMGVLSDYAQPVIMALRSSKKLITCGIYTHFASAAEDDLFTSHQVKKFVEVIEIAKVLQVSFPLVHTANSAGTLGSGPQYGSVFRVGIALYGLEPTKAAPLQQEFTPTLCWKTTVAQVKDLPANYSVGYGQKYKTKIPQRIAILPVGYSDGYRRAPGTAQYVLLKRKKCPVIGQVSMEKTAILLPNGLEAAPGDEAVLIGKQGEHQITAEELADWFGTINYEVVTSISASIPRKFIR